MTVNEQVIIINELKNRLNRLSIQCGLTTGKVREVSSDVYRLIEDRSINNVLGLCENLLGERKWELGVIAYDWAYKMKKYYNKETFAIFERWLEKYVTGWGDCDDFCTHAFGELLCQYDNLFHRILQWCNHSDFWVRRASAVILIYPIRNGKLGGFDPFIISDKLMNDEHYLVLKGYGWMLKVLSIVKPDDVFQYLIKNKTLMPRVSFRYAIEKFDVERKAILTIKEVANSIAYCGLVCKFCHLADTCDGCKSESNCCGRHLSADGCYQYNCCVERGFNGCWECDDFCCEKDMFSYSHDIRLRAFVSCAKEEGTKKLAEYVLKNQRNGIYYGYQKDYDGLGSEEKVLRLLRTGQK